MTRTIARLGAALLTLAVVALAVPASAHVSVSSPDASAGGFGKVVFRVPNESDDASTTKLVVTLPAGQPFAFVSVGAKPGWTANVDTQKLDVPAKVGGFEVSEVVRTITWTAEGEGIAPGQFDEFAISGGPFPEADSIVFGAEQIYSDGEIVNWNQEQDGDEEPEHPAPTLTLSAATTDGHSSDHDGAQSQSSDDEVKESEDEDDPTSDPGVWLGSSALVVALGALVVALRQNRRRA